MPQHDLWNGWAAERFTLTIHLPVNRDGGSIHVRLSDEFDKTQAQRSVNWRKPRDLTGLPKCASGLVAAWQYGPVLDVVGELERLSKLHLPSVPNVGRL